MRTGNIKKQKSEFEPSMRILSRILKAILECDSMGRTALAQAVNVNYPTLSKHLSWLERRSVVLYVVDGSKVIVKLNESERKFAQKICNFEN